MAPKKMKSIEVATQLQPERSYDVADGVIRVGVGCQAVPTEVDDYERSELFRVGRAIPLTWVHDDAKTSIEAFKYKFDIEMKTNTLDALRCMVVDSAAEETNRGWEDKALIHFPESFGESFTNAEHKSFVLGLYMFINNLYLVNEFMGNIGIGRLQSHYYGEFYHSEDYNRWKEWKKAMGWSEWKEGKNKKNGHRIRCSWPTYANIFTDSRHNELLSRLSANATTECKDRLAEAGKSYLRKKISLRKFICTLRDIAGMNVLVEAVAIGQEGHDLLRYQEPCYSFYIIQDPPSDHCSLKKKKQEIINILRMRISKSKSNELFWNSVWPRLVCRGWRRGQTSKKMVFLVPGIIEVSIREIFKGIHYFDSVCDILNKVALQPELIDVKGNEDITEINPTRPESRISCLMGNLKTTKPKALGDTCLDGGVDGISKTMMFDEPQDDVEILRDLTVPQVTHGSVSGDAAAGANVVQQQVMVLQRLSRRNRMLTTKAFEAFSNGYLGSKRKRKGKHEMEPARRVCGRTDSVWSDGAVNGTISG